MILLVQNTFKPSDMYSFLRDTQITFVKYNCLRLTPQNKWTPNWAFPISSRPAQYEEGKAKDLEQGFVAHKT